MANVTGNDLEQATEEHISGLRLDVEAGESALGEPEPWESWETSLVLWSIGLGIGGLIVLGTLINIFLLNN